MAKSNKLIIFFVPPKKIVNGGVMSIFSICKISRQFKKIHNASVLLSTYPGHVSYRKNDLFDNDETVYSFDELVKRGIPSTLQLHVPEYASVEVFLGLKKYSHYLKSVPDLSINIMNQNILLMQKPVEVADWFSLTPYVTQTTAHNKYTTQDFADLYNLPTHHLSVFIDPGQFDYLPYEKKKDMILLSPDLTEKRALIEKKLAEKLPTYEILTVKNMRYEDYKAVMCVAKFAMTFGEGFDGYYIEAFLSGGITFAVYNEDFFPNKKFSEFENTYENDSEMLESIVKDIERLDNKTLYERVVRQNFVKITELYDFAAYKNNIKDFYLKRFTYVPSEYSAERLIANIIDNKNSEIAQRDALIYKHQTEISTLLQELEKQKSIINKEIKGRDKIIADMSSSVSWKVTKPLRDTRAVIKKRHAKPD